MNYELRIKDKLFATFLALVFIDQISKYIIREKSGFYICNPNIAFGIEMNSSIFWIMWLTIVTLLVFAVHRYFIKDSLYVVLILSGAISNVIDRFQFGCIIDFIDLKFWPVFNLADIYITVGIVLLVRSLVKKQENSKEQENKH